MRQVGPHQMERPHARDSVAPPNLLPFLSFSESESYIVIQTGLELTTILLPQPPTTPGLPCAI